MCSDDKHKYPLVRTNLLRGSHIEFVGFYEGEWLTFGGIVGDTQELGESKHLRIRVEKLCAFKKYGKMWMWCDLKGSCLIEGVLKESTEKTKKEEENKMIIRCTSGTEHVYSVLLGPDEKIVAYIFNDLVHTMPKKCLIHFSIPVQIESLIAQ